MLIFFINLIDRSRNKIISLNKTIKAIIIKFFSSIDKYKKVKKKGKNSISIIEFFLIMPTPS